MDVLQHITDILEFNDMICAFVKNAKAIPYTNLYSKKMHSYQKLFRDISNYQNLAKEKKVLVNNMFFSLKEFLLKSVDYKQINLSDPHDLMQLIIQLNKLIAFSLDDIISAGLRTSKSLENNKNFVSQKYFKFRSPHFHEQWNISVLKPSICCLDIFLHTFKLLSYKPFKAYNVQIAFAWGWLIEKSCFYKKRIKIYSYLPWLVWVHDILMSTHFCVGGIDACLNNFLESASIYIRGLAQDQQFLQEFTQYDLTKRQLRALKYVQKHGSISREEYCKLSKISFMTAFRDLKKMVDLGILNMEGKGSKTHYVLNTSESVSS